MRRRQRAGTGSHGARSAHFELRPGQLFWLVVATGVVALATAAPAWAGGADISIVKLGASTQPEHYLPQEKGGQNKGKKGKATKSKWVEVSSAGAALWVSCFWEAKPTGLSGYAGKGPQVGASIAVNGEGIFSDTINLGPMPDLKTSRRHGTIGPVKWIAGAPGKYSFSCVIDPQNLLGEAADTRDDNTRIAPFVVGRPPTANDSLNLQFESPVFGQRYVWGEHLRVPIVINAAPTFDSLVRQQIIFSPQVSLEIHYLGNDGQTAKHAPTITNWGKPLELELDHRWLGISKPGGGRYDVTARLRYGDVIGPPVSVTFFIDSGMVTPVVSARDAAPGAGDTPAMPPAATVAQGIKVLRPGGGVAPPNPCSLEVSFYVPEAPVVRSSGSMQAGEQIEIACGFRKQTRTLSWPQCDDAAKKAMARIQSAQSSAARYSGIVQIDGNTVGVGSSPADGSDFARTQLYAFKEPGAHEIRCQTDNALRFAAMGAPTYLDSGVSIDVAARPSGRAYLRFDAAAAAAQAVGAIASQPLPDFADGTASLDDGKTASRTFEPTQEYLSVSTAQGAVSRDADANNAPATNVRAMGPLFSANADAGIACAPRRVGSLDGAYSYAFEIANAMPEPVPAGTLRIVAESASGAAVHELVAPLATMLAPGETRTVGAGTKITTTVATCRASAATP